MQKVGVFSNPMDCAFNLFTYRAHTTEAPVKMACILAWHTRTPPSSSAFSLAASGWGDPACVQTKTPAEKINQENLCTNTCTNICARKLEKELDDGGFADL